MDNLNNRKQKILEILLKAPKAQSSNIHAQLKSSGEDMSLVTIKRLLKELESQNIIDVSGKGRGTAYTISDYGRLISEVDARAYCAIDPDKRFGQTSYNFSLFEALSFDPFIKEEEMKLQEATVKYHDRINNLSTTIHEKELERFVIELSWKSSKIEGNTYTLLDTEKLIREGLEAPGHDKAEAKMILNHKEAFKFMRENSAVFNELNLKNIEEVHKILVKDLNVNFGLRKKPVGVTGSLYHPLDNGYQIGEAVEHLGKCIAQMKNPHAKALIALLGISYIQPFEDGNKRTARLMANAVLLAYNCSPLSYRSVDENAYREAMLVFYELNSLTPLKKIFIEQYVFAALNYLV